MGSNIIRPTTIDSDSSPKHSKHTTDERKLLFEYITTRRYQVLLAASNHFYWIIQFTCCVLTSSVAPSAAVAEWLRPPPRNHEISGSNPGRQVQPASNGDQFNFWCCGKSNRVATRAHLGHAWLLKCALKWTALTLTLTITANVLTAAYVRACPYHCRAPRRNVNRPTGQYSVPRVELWIARPRRDTALRVLAGSMNASTAARYTQ